MRNIIVMLGLLGGFIFLGSIDANAAECIGYNRMAGRCVTAQDRAAAATQQHWCRSPRSPTRYRC
jgi:hypothetical protein